MGYDRNDCWKTCGERDDAKLSVFADDDLSILREALESARSYISWENNPTSNRILHKIRAALDILPAKETLAVSNGDRASG